VFIHEDNMYLFVNMIATAKPRRSVITLHFLVPYLQLLAK